MSISFTDILNRHVAATALLFPTRPPACGAAIELPVPITARLVSRFGSASSNVLLDERCQHFRDAGIDGVIGYKRHGRYAIALGDPVCATEDRAALVEAFRTHFREQGVHTLFAVVGAGTAEYLRATGCGLVEFGVEQVLDPSNSVTAPGYKELRKKLKRARRAGMEVTEYRPFEDGHIPQLERQMNDLAHCWLMNRGGLQTFWAHIDLFRSPTTTRWFYGKVGDRVVGLLSTLRLENLNGYLLEHILWAPQAPVGTSESLVAHVLETLAGENCTYASFGPAPAHDLGEVSGFSNLSERSCRLIYRMARHLFQLDSKALHRQKYRPVAAQPLYLAFDKTSIGLGTLGALGHAFNFSMA